MISRLKLARAIRIIHAGGIIAYPTEAVFGLGCHPQSVEAARRICALKQRSVRAGFILIADAPDRLADWIAPAPEEARRLAAATDRPVSWIVTAGPLAGEWITGGRSTVAVRITEHPVAAALCRMAAVPLVSTSANRRRRAPARTALAVRRVFGNDVDIIVPGATGGWARPSEIRDGRTGVVLRRG